MTKLSEWMNANGKDAGKLAAEMGFSPRHVDRVAKGEEKAGGRFVVTFWQTQHVSNEELAELFSIGKVTA